MGSLEMTMLVSLTHLNNLTEIDIIIFFLIVLDVGSGSGLLSCFASKSKPRKIIAVEVNDALAGLSKRVFNANGLNHVELHNDLSTRISPSEKATVFVTETFDANVSNYLPTNFT